MALNSHSTCRITVTAAGSEFEFPCGPGDPVLSAMERQGLELIPVGCRGGGCGACKIRVLSGNYRCGPMSAAQVSPADRARRGARDGLRDRRPSRPAQVPGRRRPDLHLRDRQLPDSDPVGIAVRPDGKEVWVSNHVSDSVSVIDAERPQRA